MRCALLVVGVGGQGVLTLAQIVGEAAMAAGLPVCVGQQHGMSQRGGSVEATVVLGARARTPFVGEADVLIALEPLEALRAADRLSPRSAVVLSRAGVPLASRPDQPYPPLAELLAGVRARTARVYDLDAAALAAQAGSPRALGAVLLGAVAALGLLPLGPAALGAALSRGSPSSRGGIAAFHLGMEAVSP